MPALALLACLLRASVSGAWAALSGAGCCPGLHLLLCTWLPFLCLCRSTLLFVHPPPWHYLPWLFLCLSASPALLDAP